MNTVYVNETVTGTPISGPCKEQEHDTIAGNIVEIHRYISDAINMLAQMSELLFGKEPTPDGAVLANADCIRTELAQMKDDGKLLCDLVLKIQTRLN